MSKSRNRTYGLILCAVVFLTGCTQSSIPSDSHMQKETIIIGSDRYEPYSYQSGAGTFEGIDVELATEALARMGYEPEFKEIVWENKKAYLESGKVDCLWGCFSMNGREEEYQWAGPYLYSRQMVVVRTGSDIHKLADLDGKRVAVQETSKAEEYFLYPANEKVPDVEKVYCFSRMDEVFASLRKSYVEAICGHESALNSLIATAPGEYRMLEESLDVSELGVAFARDYDSHFVTQLEAALEEMQQDGTTAQIVQKYGIDVSSALGGAGQ